MNIARFYLIRYSCFSAEHLSLCGYNSSRNKECFILRADGECLQFRENVKGKLYNRFIQYFIYDYL